MKQFDLICLGRIAVDLYSDQVGCRLENTQSFSKYLGGSSGNIAYGSARLGLKVSMLARVGNDHLGRFIKEQLEIVNVDTSHIIFDKDRLTALVILGIKDRDTFPLIFYRENCADMAISKDDFDEEYIASSQALLITGTHFSTKSTRDVSMTAIGYAKKNAVKVILDIDYRPTLWGLTSHDDGETRFIASENVSAHLLTIFPHCDLIVGTEEEFMIGGGDQNIVQSLKNVREVTSATLVLKRGAMGNSVFEGEIPDSLDAPEVPIYQGVRVEVLNVLGAGDAFMSGYLRGWLNQKNPEECSRYANACGALVVSRHGCAPAIPTKEELDYYLENATQIPYPDQDIVLNHLHRVTTREKQWDDLSILAFDHRIQFEELVEQYGEPSAKDSPQSIKKTIIALKKNILQAIYKVKKQGSANLGNLGNLGLLLDGRYGQDLLNEVTGQGLWIARPVEKPKTKPLAFEPSHSVGTEILAWPKDHVIKCLVFAHPSDEEGLKAIQEEKVVQLYDAALKTGKELLLEVISSKDDQVLPQLLERFYQLGVKPDWWKLFPSSLEEWEGVSKVIEKNDRYCRGVLLLGLNSDIPHLTKQFQLAKQFSICKGFAIGRSIFQEPVIARLKKTIDDATMVDQVMKNYLELINLWKSI